MIKVVVFSIIIIILSPISLVATLPIPGQVKEIVVFVYVPNRDGVPIPNGTGFLVGVEDTTRTGFSFVYLVTVKHVIQKLDESFFPTVYIRLNKKGGGTGLIPLQVNTEEKGKNVFFHEDSTVDLAVIVAVPDQLSFEYKFLPHHYITTRDDAQKLRIREGDEAFFLGLFIPHIGEGRNLPIVRFGRVALIADEKINWQGTKIDLFLIETISIGGNSGSPVFFYFGPDREPGQLRLGDPILKLAGIVKGSIDARHPLEFIETDTLPITRSTIGITGVIPAHKLYEILFGAELKRQRNSIGK